MECSRIRMVVYGRVQGVGFRYSALEMAVKLGVTGFCRNLSDGTVEIEAEGDQIQLTLFEKWCRKGPPRAQVSKVNCEKIGLVEDEKFSIR